MDGACVPSSLLPEECCKSGYCDPVDSKCKVPPSSPQGKAEQLKTGAGAVKAGSALYNVGWFSDWRVTGLLGVAIAIAIIAVAAMVGHGFNLPEVKAFVDTELMQAVVSLLLIFALIGLIAFFDTIAFDAVNGAGLPVTCSGSEPCYVSAAKQYLTGLYDVGKEYAQNSLKESFDNQKWASRGVSMQFNVWWAAFAGTNSRLNAGWSIKAERAASIFETVSKLLASIYAQIYFIDVISFGIAPIFLLLGILLRTFFFTRKLGGLMLAIAIALFVIYPLTYAFAWYTLNVTIYGERTLAIHDPNCPAECMARYPVAFYIKEDGAGNARITQFETTQDIMRAGITQDNWATGAGGQYPGLVACRNLSSIGLPDSVAPNQCPDCPDYCRDVPFPSSMPGCDIAKCATCNPGCKIMRQRSDCETACPTCPDICRTTLPVENKCYFSSEKVGVATADEPIVQADLSVSCAGCKGCPTWCNILQKNQNGSYELLNKDAACTSNPACMPTPSTLPAGASFKEGTGTCPLSCMYVTETAQSTTCDEMCSDKDAAGSVTICPKYCRLTKDSLARVDANSWDISVPKLLETCYGPNADPKVQAACTKCPEGCKVEVNETPPATCAAYPYPQSELKEINDCVSCPDYCRFAEYTFIESFSRTLTTYGRTGIRVPAVCKGAAPGDHRVVDCDGSESPESCQDNCKITEHPLLCREYGAAGAYTGDERYCINCPEEVRVNLTHTAIGGAYDYNDAPPLLNYDELPGCKNAKCDLRCKIQKELVVPDYLTLAPKRTEPPKSCSVASSKVCQPDSGVSSCCSGNEECNQGDDIYSCTEPVLPPAIHDYCLLTKFEDHEEYACYLTSDRYVPTYSCSTAEGGACGCSFSYKEYRCGACSKQLSIGEECGPANDSCCPADSTCIYGKCDAVYCKDEGTSFTPSVKNPEPAQCEMCKTGCRLNVNNRAWLDPSCNTATLNGVTFNPCDESHCPTRCKAKPEAVPMCTEYKGTADQLGGMQCHGPSGCGGLDEPNCLAKYTEGCTWEPEGGPHGGGTSANCGACPENCRIAYTDGTYYTGNCGTDNGNGDYGSSVDCSEGSCNSFCRVTKYDDKAQTVTTSQEGGGCANDGASCYKQDCCFGLTCRDLGSGNKRCVRVPPAEACKDIGTLCDNSDAADPNKDCCGDLVCKTDVASGKDKCSANCSNLGDPCGHLGDPQCCLPGLACDTDTGGSYTCNATTPTTCAGIGDSCDMGCCPDTVCSGGTCAPPGEYTCKPFQSTLSCFGCPAACRRNSNQEIPASPEYCPTLYCGDYNKDQNWGCNESCRLPDAPYMMCDSCLECPSDCLYKPAVRTDCSEVCSDEALMGPANVGPQDFIKKLPGAQGDIDVKNVGVLMVPALILPLFSLVIVISFIRTLSPILGGDIEIPGLSRII